MAALVRLGLTRKHLAASGFLPQGMGQKSLEQGGRDYVMVKLGDTIQPMKESFFVAFLACKDARPEDMVVPKEIEEYREKHGIVSKNLIVEDETHKGEDHLGDAETRRERKPTRTWRWPKTARTGGAKPADRRKASRLEDGPQTAKIDGKPADDAETEVKPSVDAANPQEKPVDTMKSENTATDVEMSEDNQEVEKVSLQVCGFCVRR